MQASEIRARRWAGLAGLVTIGLVLTAVQASTAKILSQSLLDFLG